MHAMISIRVQVCNSFNVFVGFTFIRINISMALCIYKRIFFISWTAKSRIAWYSIHSYNVILIYAHKHSSPDKVPLDSQVLLIGGH